MSVVLRKSLTKHTIRQQMNAARVVALETAEEDRARRRKELKCEFVRGNVMEHEVSQRPACPARASRKDSNKN
eukprot:1896410-Rhodomonas_salina.1